VASLVRVTATPVLGQTTVVSVTVTNVSHVFIPGPILLAFTSLPQGTRLVSVNGSSIASNLFVVAGLDGLAPGQSASALVSFTGLLAQPLRGLRAEILAELPSVSPPPLPLAGAPAPASFGTPDPVWSHPIDPSPWLTDLLVGVLANRKP
jgi:UDP-N-acetylmuramyl pentapeptide phosphotransferase/UDP-N-acetylglucosamine-1-phosphate transferase